MACQQIGLRKEDKELSFRNKRCYSFSQFIPSFSTLFSPLFLLLLPQTQILHTSKMLIQPHPDKPHEIFFTWLFVFQVTHFTSIRSSIILYFPLSECSLLCATFGCFLIYMPHIITSFRAGTVTTLLKVVCYSLALDLVYKQCSKNIS